MEFGLKQVALLIFGLVLALPRVSKLIFGGAGEKTYWHQVERWKEEEIDFLVPNPMDQRMLYRTVKEVEKPLEVPGEGDGLPDWLAGTLIRDGPGLFEFGEFSADHAFDGMAMLRRYQIGPKEDEGSLAMNYSRRLVQSKVLQANLEAQMFTKFGVGTPPSDTSILKRLKGLTEEGGDNVVVQSIILHGHYYAATEINIVIEYDPETLATIGRRDVADLIPGIKLMTPHPMYDPDGTLWNIALCMGPTKDGVTTSGWKYVLFKVPPPNSPETERDPWLGLQIVFEMASTRLSGISYLHSFFMTKNYLIFTEQPWVIGDLRKTLINHVLQGKSLGQIMYWDSEQPLRFHVIEKSSGKRTPLNYEADPMGFFHIINAYEESGHLVLDAPFKAKPISYDVFMVKNLASEPDQLREYMVANGPAAGTSKRWVLPLSVATSFSSPDLRLTLTGRLDPDSFRQVGKLGGSRAKAYHAAHHTVYLQPELLAPVSQYQYHRALEFAAVNPGLWGEKYRFAYGLGFPTGYLCGSIHKLDVEKKEFVAQWEDPACRATEPLFVPRPGSIEEEDGVVVFACLGTDPESPSTWFVVLHPKDLKELGRFPVADYTPVGFHGIWIPQQKQQQQQKQPVQQKKNK